MKNLCLIFSFVLISGCATVAKSNGSVASVFMLGEWDGKTSSEVIDSSLTRGAGGLVSPINYAVEITPYTNALIAAKANEAGKRNLDPEDKISSVILEQKKYYLSDRTCFLVTLKTRILEDAKFVNWRAKVKDQLGKLEEGIFLNTTGVDSVPRAMGHTGGDFPWFNGSVLCFRPKVDYSKAFTVIMLPQNTANMKTSEMTWTVEETKN